MNTPIIITADAIAICIPSSINKIQNNEICFSDQVESGLTCEEVQEVSVFEIANINHVANSSLLNNS
jgi:hypothetical protein